MKTTLLSLFFALISSTLSFADDSAPICEDMLITHMRALEQSETFIAGLKSKEEDITAFDITQLQKNLTARFGSLKGLLEIYKNKELNCQPKILAQAIAVYDLSRLGQSVFAHTELRRIVLGLSKYSRYRLTDLVALYKKYTNGETIAEIQHEIVRLGVVLPDGVTFDPNHRDYDPNLYKLSDAAVKGSTSVVAGAARIWGFISDQLKWRSGRINHKDKAISLVRENLKPLDLLFEKRTFTLSNYTIPGHFGHVAVWLGTKEELIAMGVWDKEFFRPFRSFIEAGLSIVEIRKEGLNFQSVESFMNLDEMAVTRIENIESRALAVYEELSEQIDKKYDFKFDAHSADKITCAELIAFSYGDIKWPQTKTLFQYTLRPDDLAVLTLDKTSPAKFVLYLKGQKNTDPIVMTEKDWRKLFNVEKHLTPEERAEREAQKIAQYKKADEERLYREMYSN